MKQIKLLPIIIGVAIIVLAVFLYLNSHEIKEPKQVEPFGFAPCNKNIMGCSYKTQNEKAVLGNLPAPTSPAAAKIAKDLQKLYDILINDLPSDYAWIQTINGPKLFKQPFPPGIILSENDLRKLSAEQLHDMTKVLACTVYNMCDFGQPPKSVDDCNTLECMQQKFLATGCTKNGTGYPTEDTYDYYSQTPPEIADRVLWTLKNIKKMKIPNPSFKALLNSVCFGPVNGRTINLANPEPVDAECDPKIMPSPYNCVKTKLRSIYDSQKPSTIPTTPSNSLNPDSLAPNSMPINPM
jgi:hypothetical protein